MYRAGDKVRVTKAAEPYYSAGEVAVLVQPAEEEAGAWWAQFDDSRPRGHLRTGCLKWYIGGQDFVQENDDV